VIWQYWIYLVALMIGGGFSVFLAFSGWKQRNSKEGRYFTLLMLTLVIWIFLQAFELIAQELQTKILISKFQYIGIVSVGPLFLLFILAYTRQIKKWKPIHLLLLWFIPIISLLLTWTNEFHRLIWPQITIVHAGTKNIAEYSHGFFVFLLAVYAYLLCLLGEIYLFYYLKRCPREDRKKIYLVMVGVLFPIVGSILYLCKIIPYSGMDLAPFSFLLSGIVISISVFRFKLLDIIPIALDLLFTSMAKGVLAFDKNDRIVAINPAAVKIFLFPKPVIGKRMEEAFLDFPEFARQFHQLLTKSNEFEIENPTKTGWLNARVSPIEDSGNNPSGKLIILEDITKRKQTEKNLRDSKERFEQVAEQAREIIWEVDITGLYTYISPKIESIVGYKPEEIIGKMYFYDLHPEELKQKTKEEVFRVFEKKEIFRDYINEVETKEGKRLFFSSNAVPILDGKNKLLGYRGSDFDITMIKKMEHMKDDFISTVSHELRTPLTIIKESINIVMKEYTGPLNQVQKETLLIGKRNVDRLSRLINDVLDIQKLQFDGFSMNLVAADINQIALDTETNMRTILTEKGLELKTDLDPDIPLVMVDKDRIMQVFMNLINNAIKFTNNGFILIKTERWNKDFAKVMIQDTGIGIAKEDIDKLFHRFSQIESKDHPKHGSTGLGLAICKEIIEKHHGKIWVESESGRGSTFIFTLPFSVEKEMLP
jgi:PAS domain S-box-containing protein